MKKYFFINSNICFPDEELNFDKFIYNISGNTGNSYITYSIIKALYGKFQKVDDIKNLWFYQANQRDIDRINNEYSKVILVLQDNLRLFDSYLTHDIYEGLTDFFRKIKIPIVVFSLGSNSFDNNWQALQDGLNKNLVSLLKTISDNTVSFGVRGKYTLDVLDKLGIKNAEVVGCPSYFETGKNRVIQKPKLKSDFRVLSGGYFKNISTENVHYVLQDEALFMKAIAFDNEKLLEQDFKGIKIKDDYQDFLIKAYLENRMAVFSDMEKWKKFDKKFDFYIGTRVHGAIMAMNAGLPAIITSGDSRSEEMCNLFGISRRLDISNNCNLRDVYEEIDVVRVNKKYPALYENYLKWLSKNGLEVFSSEASTEDSSFSNISEYSNSVGDYKINSDLLGRYIDLCKRSVVDYSDKASVSSELEVCLDEKDSANIVNTIKSNKNSKIIKLVSKIVTIFVIGKNNRKKVRNAILKRLS